MRVFSEILNEVRGEYDVSHIRYTVLDGGGGYFQNVKRILEFSKTVIVFSGRKHALRVEGEELTLNQYDVGDVAVGGKILKIEHCNVP